MNEKIKYFIIPFILMILINLGTYLFTFSSNFGEGINPHLGIIFISGLFFGPWGCFGAVTARMLCDIYRGYDPLMVILLAVMGFVVSYLAYKIWYTKDLNRTAITKPRFSNIANSTDFLGIIIACAIIYSLLTSNMMQLLNNWEDKTVYLHIVYYFINFVNFALLFSMIGMVIMRFKDFSYTPEVSQKKYNPKIYDYMEILLPVTLLLLVIFNIAQIYFDRIFVLPWIILFSLLVLYLRKPITHLEKIEYVSVTEKVMDYFVIILLLITAVNALLLFSSVDAFILKGITYIAGNDEILFNLLVIDMLLILLYVPIVFVLRYIEEGVVNPLMSLSKIRTYIGRNKKIESEKILDIYSKYIDQDDEIGVLSRSYAELIENNNEYIENVETLEGEKLRTKAELDIAHNIQSAALPRKFINDEFVFIDGFSKQAKEVGGDFYDFYDLDGENTVIVIGDASDKGVPASIFTLITQIAVKLLIRNDNDPSKVFTDLNALVTDSNSEMFFITLFLGIFNKKSHELTYANAGHTPPLIKRDGIFEVMDVDSEIVLGIMEDYEYSSYTVQVDEELLLYTDGITDAQNKNKEFYGETRLINILNDNKEYNTLNNIVEDITNFTVGEQQFDDMTLLIMKVKQ